MKFKDSTLYSILLNKCPRCHQGDMFITKAFNLKHFTDMHENCEHCNQRFELEPYFYSGAMYVSYALQVAIFTTVYVALRVLFNPETEVYIISTIATIILLSPVTLRTSRSTYINFFIHYNKEVAHQSEEMLSQIKLTSNHAEEQNN